MINHILLYPKIILSTEEKKKLFKQKIVSISSMLGLAWLSMMKMPNLGMLEFKKFFL